MNTALKIISVIGLFITSSLFAAGVRPFYAPDFSKSYDRFSDEKLAEEIVRYLKIGKFYCALQHEAALRRRHQLSPNTSGFILFGGMSEYEFDTLSRHVIGFSRFTTIPEVLYVGKCEIKYDEFFSKNISEEPDFKKWLSKQKSSSDEKKREESVVLERDNRVVMRRLSQLSQRSCSDDDDESPRRHYTKKFLWETAKTKKSLLQEVGGNTARIPVTVIKPNNPWSVLLKEQKVVLARNLRPERDIKKRLSGHRIKTPPIPFLDPVL